MLPVRCYSKSMIRAGFYQFDPRFGEKDSNLKKAVSAIEGSEADLIVLPELFATGYQFTSKEEVAALSESIPDGITTKTLSELSISKKIYIVAGLAEAGKDGRLYNSAILTGPEGFIGLYRKTHLFFEEKLYFSPGDTGFRVWDTTFGKLGVMICFDWYFPESVRTLAMKGALVVAHPSNLVLPHCPTSMPVRCLENRVFAVTANRIGAEERKPGRRLEFIGQSVICTPKAETLTKAPPDEEALMIAEIDPSQAIDKSLNKYNDIFKDRRPKFYDV